jgi:hypothetical protein
MRAGDTRDDDRERLAGCAGDGGDDRERRDEAVLEPEDDLPDLAQQRARSPFFREVLGDPSWS